VARRAVALHGSAALARCRIAHARLVALVSRVADDRRTARAGPRLARIGLRARIPVVARGAVALHGTGAGARGRIAHARRVALVRRAADDRRTARAGPRLARIGLHARIPVVARGAVALHGTGARARGRIAHARRVALVRRAADDRRTARPGPRRARVGLRARVPGVARGAVELHGTGARA